MTAPMVLDGAMNGTAFRAYVEQVLLPTLTPGDIVVMDNLPAHKADGGGRLLKVPVAGYSTSHPIALTSIPSKRPSPSSRHFCEPEQNAPSKHSGTPSARSSRSSNPKNAPITSRHAVMTPNKMDVL